MISPQGDPEKTPIDPRRIEVIDRKTAEIMRRLSGTEKIRLACALGDGLRRMIRYHITQTHPDWTENQVRRELARRVLADDALCARMEKAGVWGAADVPTVTSPAPSPATPPPTTDY